MHVEPVNSISVVSVAEPGNGKVEAGSESAGALTDSAATDERVAESLGQESKKEEVVGDPAPPKV